MSQPSNLTTLKRANNDQHRHSRRKSIQTLPLRLRSGQAHRHFVKLSTGLKEELPETFVGAMTAWLKAPFQNFRNLRKLSHFDDDPPSPNGQHATPNSQSAIRNPTSSTPSTTSPSRSNRAKWSASLRLRSGQALAATEPARAPSLRQAQYKAQNPVPHHRADQAAGPSSRRRSSPVVEGLTASLTRRVLRLPKGEVSKGCRFFRGGKVY